jgi:hypothetical protein
MKTIQVMGHVDEHHRLSADVPTSVPPGPVKVVLEVGVDEEAESSAQWAAAISQAWAADWDDPREDLYSLKDGEHSGYQPTPTSNDS